MTSQEIQNYISSTERDIDLTLDRLKSLRRIRRKYVAMLRRLRIKERGQTQEDQ